MATTAHPERPGLIVLDGGREDAAGPSDTEADALYAEALATARRAARIAAALERAALSSPDPGWADAAAGARRAESALRLSAEAVPEIAPASDGRREGVLRIGALVVDRGRRAARYGGRPLALTRLEFDLLATLAEHGGGCVTKADLLRRVWRYEGRAVRTRTVDSHASRVRRTLAAEGAPGGAIENVWGVGYRLGLPDDAPPERAA